MKTLRINHRPRLLRATIARGLAEGSKAIDRTGGDNGAGIIRGMAIIARGEALGHGGWIDHVMLGQVANAINATDGGAKARFTHPSLSGDGLGKFTGRVKDAPVNGDVVRGDLHFSTTAHNTPDGNLAGYMMDLATEDPTAFGNSISFESDEKAEELFALQHGAEWRQDDWGNEYLDFTKFKSPDPRNTGNLPHFRLKALHAVDAVDEPAANPSGLFHRDASIALEADRIASYALGLSRERPTLVTLDVDPDRIAAFFTRFLGRQKLALCSIETGEIMSLSQAKHFANRGAELKAKVSLAAEKCMDDEDGDGDEEKLADKESTDDEIEDKEQEEGDADKQVGDDKSTDSRQRFAKGGEAPSGTSAGDEQKRQDEYQDVQKEEEEEGKKDAEEDTPVGSPSSESRSKGIGPMDDPSSNHPSYSRKTEGEQFLKAFGEIGGVWFAQGRTFEEARELHVARLKADNERLEKENGELHKKLHSRRGEAKPLASSGAPATAADAKLSKLTSRLGPNMARFAAGLQIPGSQN